MPDSGEADSTDDESSDGDGDAAADDDNTEASTFTADSFSTVCVEDSDL